MFHFPATPPPALYIQAGATGHQAGQVTPFGNPGITVQLATPPGISQPHTSFIGHPAPRHPPCALHNLTNTRPSQIETKTLTHTIQISNNTPATPDTLTSTRPVRQAQAITTTARGTNRMSAARPGSETYCLRTPTGCETRQTRHPHLRTDDLANRSQGWERAKLAQTTCSRHTI